MVRAVRSASGHERLVKARGELKPAAGGRSLRFDLGGGDLLVMGGACQRTWRYGIPKVKSAGPRISIQFHERREYA